MNCNIFDGDERFFFWIADVGSILSLWIGNPVIIFRKSLSITDMLGYNVIPKFLHIGCGQVNYFCLFLRR